MRQDYLKNSKIASLTRNTDPKYDPKYDGIRTTRKLSAFSHARKPQSPPRTLLGERILGVETRNVVLESEFPPVVQLPGIHYTTVSKVMGKAGVSKK